MISVWQTEKTSKLRLPRAKDRISWMMKVGDDAISGDPTPTVVPRSRIFIPSGTQPHAPPESSREKNKEKGTTSQSLSRD